jgi:hypothetical protein
MHYDRFVIDGHVSRLQPAIRNRLAELQQYFTE